MAVVDLSDKPHGFNVGIVCVAASATFAYPRTSVVAEPQKAAGSFVRCPRSAPTPIASFFHLQSGSPSGGAIVATMGQTYNKKGVASSQLGVMSNLTNQPIGLIIGAVCSSLRVTTEEASGTASPGKVDGFTFKCRPGEHAAGSAFFPTKGGLFSNIALVDSFLLRPAPPGRRWAVAVKDLGTAPLRYVVAEVCIS